VFFTAEREKMLDPFAQPQRPQGNTAQLMSELTRRNDSLKEKDAALRDKDARIAALEQAAAAPRPAVAAPVAPPTASAADAEKLRKENAVLKAKVATLESTVSGIRAEVSEQEQRRRSTTKERRASTVVAPQQAAAPAATLSTEAEGRLMAVMQQQAAALAAMQQQLQQHTMAPPAPVVPRAAPRTTSAASGITSPSTPPEWRFVETASAQGKKQAVYRAPRISTASATGEPKKRGRPTKEEAALKVARSEGDGAASSTAASVSVMTAQRRAPPPPRDFGYDVIACFVSLRRELRDERRVGALVRELLSSMAAAAAREGRTVPQHLGERAVFHVRSTAAAPLTRDRREELVRWLMPLDCAASIENAAHAAIVGALGGEAADDDDVDWVGEVAALHATAAAQDAVGSLLYDACIAFLRTLRRLRDDAARFSLMRRVMSVVLGVCRATATPQLIAQRRSSLSFIALQVTLAETCGRAAAVAEQWAAVRAVLSIPAVLEVPLPLIMERATTVIGATGNLTNGVSDAIYALRLLFQVRDFEAFHKTMARGQLKQSASACALASLVLLDFNITLKAEEELGAFFLAYFHPMFGTVSVVDTDAATLLYAANTLLQCTAVPPAAAAATGDEHPVEGESCAAVKALVAAKKWVANATASKKPLIQKLMQSRLGRRVAETAKQLPMD
jgi:hypothetical protein